MGKAKAKSVPAGIWDQHKQQLHNLYITKRNTVDRIQDKMAKKGFHASKHQYRDKFKIWKFRKNCPRPRPVVPVTEHGTNGALGLGILTTPHTEVTMEPFIDITDFEADASLSVRESAAPSDRVGEERSPFLEMAPDIFWNEYPVLQKEGNTATNGALSFEASSDSQPTSIQTHSLVDAGIPHPNMDSLGYFDLESIHPDDINEGARDDLGVWEFGAFDQVQSTTYANTATDPLGRALFDRCNTSGGESNYFLFSRRSFL